MNTVQPPTPPPTVASLSLYDGMLLCAQHMAGAPHQIVNVGGG